jgi:hypothetical protein
MYFVLCGWLLCCGPKHCIAHVDALSAARDTHATHSAGEWRSKCLPCISVQSIMQGPMRHALPAAQQHRALVSLLQHSCDTPGLYRQSDRLRIAHRLGMQCLSRILLTTSF